MDGFDLSFLFLFFARLADFARLIRLLVPPLVRLVSRLRRSARRGPVSPASEGSGSVPVSRGADCAPVPVCPAEPVPVALFCLLVFNLGEDERIPKPPLPLRLLLPLRVLTSSDGGAWHVLLLELAPGAPGGPMRS